MGLVLMNSHVRNNRTMSASFTTLFVLNQIFDTKSDVAADRNCSFELTRLNRILHLPKPKQTLFLLTHLT